MGCCLQDMGLMLTPSTSCHRMLMMSTSRLERGVDRVRPYHHGNLKDALLDAAAALITEVGPQYFTLREVTRRAGVSHNAPYRHFRDKDELLAAVAAQGFRELTRAMQEAVEPQSNALDKLKQSGLAYVAFAIRRPEPFTVMFDAPVI